MSNKEPRSWKASSAMRRLLEEAQARLAREQARYQETLGMIAREAGVPEDVQAQLVGERFVEQVTQESVEEEE